MPEPRAAHVAELLSRVKAGEKKLYLSRSPSRACSGERAGRRRRDREESRAGAWCSPTREGVYQGVCSARTTKNFALHETAIPVQGGIYCLCNSERIADVKPSRTPCTYLSRTPLHQLYLHICIGTVDNSRAYAPRRAAPLSWTANLQAGSGKSNRRILDEPQDFSPW